MLIQYRRVTDTQPRRRSIYRAYYVARVKTAKPILKLFRPSGSHIILVSSDPFADIEFQGGTPFSRGVKYTGGNFQRKSSFMSETV